MNFVVIGTDHRLQFSERGFEALVSSLADERFFEPLGAIAEEYPEGETVSSVGQRVAQRKNVRWYNLDMTIEEKQTAGVLQEQVSRRGKRQESVTYRLSSDDIREEAWTQKLTKSESGTTIVICGYLHFEPLVRRLREQGHAVDKRIYLEAVPEIKQHPSNSKESDTRN